MIDILDRLQATITLLEAYEQPISLSQIEEALSALRDLQEALRQLPSPEPFPRACRGTVREPGSTLEDMQARLRLTLTIPYAREKADDARLALAVFTPHGQSKARRWLQMRRKLASVFREVSEIVREVHALSTTREQRARPSYLRLIPEEGESTQETSSIKGSDSGVVEVSGARGFFRLASHEDG